MLHSAFSRPRLATAAEFLLYALLTAFALHATWLTWPDAYIDFSRELYLPWRVSCGDVLYRDLAYYFGPVSVYSNAALFAILGRPSIHALFALNFAFWIATLVALRALLRRIASPLAATLSVCTFILLFSFNRFNLTGNYNFLAPYSHELTRGFLFALLSLLALDSALLPAHSPGRETANGRMEDIPELSRPVRLLLSGFFYALVLFTKPELSLAATASLALLFVLHAWQCRSLPLRPFLVFSLAVLATVALVVAPFAVAFHSLPRALHDTLLKLYLDCFNPALAALPFYRDIMGTNEILPNVLRLLCGGLLSILPFPLARLAIPRICSRPRRLAATTLIALAAAAIGFFAFNPINAAIPLAPLLFAIISFRQHRRPARDGDSENQPPSEILNSNFENRLPLALSFAFFSFFLSAKILLDAHIWHYGFVLTLPSFCCAVLLAFHHPAPAFRTFIATALLFGFSAAAIRMHVSSVRDWDIAHPIMDDAFLAPCIQANAFNDTLDWIRANTAPDSTLAVFPEGAILNVLSGRPNPTPFVYLSNGDWLRFGESSVLAAYSNSPPRHHRPHSQGRPRTLRHRLRPISHGPPRFPLHPHPHSHHPLPLRPHPRPPRRHPHPPSLLTHGLSHRIPPPLSVSGMAAPVPPSQKRFPRPPKPADPLPPRHDLAFRATLLAL